MKWRILFIGLLLASCGPSIDSESIIEAATTLNSPTCSRTDVNTTIGSAADGDTVSVPPGSCAWTTKITITSKSISLIGSGSGVGGTTIDMQDTTSPCGLDWITKATGGSPAGFSRLSGFKFQSTAGCNLQQGDKALVTFRGVSHNTRIDHNEVSAPSVGNAFLISEDVRGVGDHITAKAINFTNENLHILATCKHAKWDGGVDYGDKSWAVASTWGTADAWYWEDNIIDNQMLFSGGKSFGVFADDNDSGCRIVRRFNSIHNTTLQEHGTETGGRIRGYRQAEDYRNVFTWDYNNSFPSVMAYRGGSFRVFDNAITVSGPGITRAVDFNTYRADDTRTWFAWGACGGGKGGPQTLITSLTGDGVTASATTDTEHHIDGAQPGARSYVRVTGANQAGFNVDTPFVKGTRVDATHFTYPSSGTGTATGSPVLTSPFDGNTDTNGYPCLDQTGRGAGTLYANSYAVGITPEQTASQASEPAYIFNNVTCTPGPCPANSVLSAGEVVAGANVIVSLRDYYNEHASFDGTNGVGRGERASRPGTCVGGATGGNAYWATDGGGNWNTSTTETNSVAAGYTAGQDGALDVCVNNAWVDDFYVPYTYPHPLQNVGRAPGPFSPPITLRRVLYDPALFQFTPQGFIEVGS